MVRGALAFRLCFLIFACLVTSVYEVTVVGRENVFQAIFLGIMKGGLVFLPLLACEMVMRTFSLYLIRRLLFGIAVGTVIGLVLALVCSTLFSFFGLAPGSFSNFGVLTLYSLYLGIVIAMAKEDKWQFAMSLLNPTNVPVKEIKRGGFIADLSALEDSRFFDLAKTGILDEKLVIPMFVIKEVNRGLDSSDEAIKLRCRKACEQLKKLEALPKLRMQYKECATAQQDDVSARLISAAKTFNAAIITCGEVNPKPGDELHVTVINLEAIAHAVKPSAQRGELLSIKIQRPGKEPKQGVGYLDDGTMVVVNGGGDFLGEVVKVQVLSQKYSTSGKIIFCNAHTEDAKAPSLRGGFGQDDGRYTVSPYMSLGQNDRKDDVYVSTPSFSSFSSPDKRRL